MESWILGTQMGQATVIRHALERNRARWPKSAAICYYKFTDVYPACSWSTVDYYGVPKLSYYVLKDSYEPLACFVIFDSINAENGLDAPVTLLDDADSLSGKTWKVCVKAYDENLKLIKEYNKSGSQSVNRIKQFENFSLNAEETKHSPILITSEVIVEETKIVRTFYWLNYNNNTGCLFNLPKAKLKYDISDSEITVVNIGDVPAVGVSIVNLAHDTEFTVEDSVFWLEVGEKRTLKINIAEGIKLRGWNI